MSFTLQLEKLCRGAKIADDNGTGSLKDFESHLIAILDLCESAMADGREKEVVAGLIAIGTGGIDAPSETLPFCLHRLRLAAVISALEDYLSAQDHASRQFHDFQQYLAGLRNSFADDWRDREMFTLYQAK